mgnify:CR=1 FL=1
MNENEENEMQEKLKLQQQINALETLAKQYMTNEAISRYGNIKSAHKEKALQLIAIIAQLIQKNQIQEKITDAQLKQLLINLNEPKRETKIIRR